jgi:hypothetical protein
LAPGGGTRAGAVKQAIKAACREIGWRSLVPG